MLTPPVFLLLVSLQIAVGALIAASSLTWTLLLWASAIGSLLGALFLGCQSQDFENAKRAMPALVLIGFLFLAPALGFVYANWRFPRVSNIDLAQFAGQHVLLEGAVETVLPLKNKGQARFICSAKSVSIQQRGNALSRKCDGTTLLLIRPGSAIQGKLTRKTFFRCRCTVTSLADLEKRGRGGYATYLKRIGINSLCYLDGRKNALEVEESTGTASEGSPKEKVSEAVEFLRTRLIAAHIHNLGQKIGSLLTAMVLGEKAVGLDPELLNSFRNVGLSHVLAASGFNLTVVTLSTHWACRALCIPSVGTNCMSFAMMIVFVLFAGNSSSVVRASLMCALAIFCSCLGRRVHIAGLLGAALLISVLIDPLSVADPGFQLSYSAVAGIIFVVSPIAIYLEAAIERRWLRWTLDCLCTVLVAQACVLPLQLFYFRQIGLLFLPANIMASLVVTPVTVAGFASSLVVLLCPFGTFGAPPFQWLAALLDWLAAVPLNILVSFVAALSSCRWAVLTVPNFALWQVILYYLAFVCFSVALTGRLKEMEKTHSQSVSAEECDG